MLNLIEVDISKFGRRNYKFLSNGSIFDSRKCKIVFEVVGVAISDGLFWISEVHSLFAL